ncbi:MAG: 4-hydroxy-tetrahydrodipicolinate reductase [Chloroflexi bacterium]|nr:4-hydroxy-tetrahydrodipicolinate reductase [Chloroflexota bacterium]
MEPIKVVVRGVSGKMGREVLNALCRDKELEPVGAAELKVTEEYLSLPDGSGLIPFSSDLASLLQRSRPHVLVDFTSAEAVTPAVRTATSQKVNLVIGTTGISEKELHEIDELAKANGVGAVVAPNFAIGAVVMIHLAKIAAKYFDHAEIIEMHHEQKMDAPSGTAMATAREMAKSRGKSFLLPTTSKHTLEGTRGGNLEGISVHSVRLPGLVAHQEIIMGTLGQTLTIRHDSTSRESFMPGVIFAIKKVRGMKGLVFGLDRLLGMKEDA